MFSEGRKQFSLKTNMSKVNSGQKGLTEFLDQHLTLPNMQENTRTMLFFINNTLGSWLESTPQ